MKLTYHRCDDCLPPDLAIPDKSVTLGKYGILCKTYLKRSGECIWHFVLLRKASMDSLSIR